MRKPASVITQIPVFVSTPNALHANQQTVYDSVMGMLNDEGMQPRTLGRTDFPHSDPMTECYFVARACYGGIILGFSQIHARGGVLRKVTEERKRLPTPAVFPTPWNQIEAGILVALRKPILVFAENGISGGVFDPGAFPGFLQSFSAGEVTPADKTNMRERIRLWSSDVRRAFRA